MTLGEKLYQLRKGRGISQEALAQKMNVSRQAISRWELDEVVPDTANVLAISNMFGVSTDYLLREDCREERDTPAVQNAEEDTRRRILSVNLGLIFRIIYLAAALDFGLWRTTREPSWGFGTLFLTAVGAIGLFWWNFRWYIKEQGSRKLLKWDTLFVLMGIYLPWMLTSIPRNWGLVLGEIPSVLLLSYKIRPMFFEHYQVYPPKKRKEKHGSQLK